MSKDGESDRKKGRRLKESERALWSAATKDVHKLAADLEPNETAPSAPPKIKMPLSEARLPPAPSMPVRGFEDKGVLDRRTESRLKGGEMKIEGRLDLHGFRAVDARAKLVAFIAKSIASGKRCVLVITGKGSADGKGSGIIRREFKYWLEDPSLRPHILSVTEAAPKHGGGGAWYVYLKKIR